MEIDYKETYNQAFLAQRHASDFRAKIISGWATMHTAVAAAFVWFLKENKSLAWVALYIGFVMTLLFWGADRRNNLAIQRAKKIGEYIEETIFNEMPDQVRFFSRLDKGVSHTSIINGFAVVSLIALLGATIYLAKTQGLLP